MITYEKVMTRDAPLIIIEAWCTCFDSSIPAACGIKWPTPIFVFRNGAVESQRPTRLFHEELPPKLSLQLKKPEYAKNALQSFEKYYKYAKYLKGIKIKKVGSEEALKEIKTASDAFTQGGAGLILGYWCVEWNKKAADNGKASLFSEEIIEGARKTREGDTLMDNAVEAVYDYLDIIAENENWPRSLMKFFTLKELEESIKTKKPDSELLRKRKNGYICLNGKVVLANEIKVTLQKLGINIEEPETTQPTQLDKLKGFCACQGYAKGKVAVIFNREQLNKIEDGGILVAPMTTPLFMPAMQKAVAFVTDEGGLLSHAAIIAREMKKPCVIGTKIATQVLKDGDLVEVDANKGIVRKIK